MSKPPKKARILKSAQSAGVRPGFQSWPEIPGFAKSNVYAIHTQLLFTQWMAPAILQHLQLLQIENLLRFAGKNAPFYRDSLKFLDNLPSRGLSEAHFAKLPILMRQD